MAGPITILGEAQEEIAGIDLLEMGADAYLTYPVKFRDCLLGSIPYALGVRQIQLSSRGAKQEQ